MITRRFRLLTLVLATLPLTAFAAGPKVYVPPYASVYGSVPVDVGVKTAGLVTEELKAQGQVTLVDGPSAEVESKDVKTQDPAEAEKAKGQIEKADAMARQADEAMVKLRFRKAIKSYKTALEIYEKNLEYVTDYDRLHYLRLSLATALFRTGEEGQGERVLADVVRLDPARALDEEMYPPVFIRAYGQVRDKLLRLARGSVEVRTEPAGAEVSVDGQVLGKTPIMVRDLVRGAHVVRIVAGGSVIVEEVQVTPVAPKKISLDFGGGGFTGKIGALTTALGNNEFGDDALAAATGLAASVGADYLVVGAMNRNELNFDVKSWVFRAKDKTFGALSEVVFDQDLLGASIEVFKLGGEINDALTAKFPEAVKLPKMVFSGAKKQEAEVTEVSVAPAAGAASTGGSGPAKTGGPVAAGGGPVTPGGTTKAGGPVRPSGPLIGGGRGGPVRPGGGPVTGPVTSPKDEETDKRDEKVSLMARGDQDLSGLSTGGMVTIDALEADEVEIPKDEIDEDKGTPWWVWAAAILVVGGAGGGVGYAASQGAFSGSPESGNITFTW